MKTGSALKGALCKSLSSREKKGSEPEPSSCFFPLPKGRSRQLIKEGGERSQGADEKEPAKHGSMRNDPCLLNDAHFSDVLDDAKFPIRRYMHKQLFEDWGQFSA
jgi:hypothetical protein